MSTVPNMPGAAQQAICCRFSWRSSSFRWRSPSSSAWSISARPTRWQRFWRHGSPEARAIIIDIRLPRILTGMLAGIHFALAGLLLQSITRNPLADPSLMGVSQGAMLAVSGFLVFSVYSHDTGSTTLQELLCIWLPLVGTAGGLAAGGFIYLIAFRRNLGPLRITLCGIAVGAVLHAIGIGLMAVGAPAASKCCSNVCR